MTSHKKIASNKAKRANLKTDVTRKEIMPNFPKNKDFLPSPSLTNTCVCASGGKKCLFSLENLLYFVFLLYPLQDSPFCLIVGKIFSLKYTSNSFKPVSTNNRATNSYNIVCLKDKNVGLGKQDSHNYGKEL